MSTEGKKDVQGFSAEEQTVKVDGQCKDVVINRIPDFVKIEANLEKCLTPDGYCIGNGANLKFFLTFGNIKNLEYKYHEGIYFDLTVGLKKAEFVIVTDGMSASTFSQDVEFKSGVAESKASFIGDEKNLKWSFEVQDGYCFSGKWTTPVKFSMQQNQKQNCHFTCKFVINKQDINYEIGLKGFPEDIAAAVDTLIYENDYENEGSSILSYCYNKILKLSKNIPVELSESLSKCKSPTIVLSKGFWKCPVKKPRKN